MRESTDSPAMKQIQKARVQLVMNHPFFGQIALHLHLRETHAIPTLAVSTKSMFFNPDYVAKLSSEAVVSAVMHEVMHRVLLCHERLGSRDIKIWNMAQDYCINYILKQSGIHLEPGWLYDEELGKLDADEVYRKLMESAIKIPMIGIGSGKGDGNEDDDASGGKSQGDKDGDGDEDDGEGQAVPDPDEANDHQDCGCGWIAPPEEPMTESNRNANEAEMKRIIAAAATIQRMAGNTPAGLERFIDSLLHPKVDWRSVLRQFVEQRAKNDYNWMRPNRRYIGGGLYLPSLDSLETGELVIAVDSSGSTMGMMNQFIAELSGILEMCRPTKVYVVYCDAAVGSYEEFGPDDLPLKVHVTGGGGTRFSPMFEWVQEQGIYPRAMIYLTDLECNDYPDDEPDYPVLWAYMGSHGTTPPFGQVVEIDDEN